MNGAIAPVTEVTALSVPVANAVAVVPEVPMAGPMAMMIQAKNAGFTMEDMRGMLDLQVAWEANEARKAYVAAMAEFKLNPPEILKTKQVQFSDVSYMHATLGDVCEAIVHGLAQNGISHAWDTKQEGGRITVTCTLTHRLGHSERTSLDAQPDASGKKNQIQQVASTITYLQRYTLLSASGLASKDMPDDDGRGGDDRTHDASAMVSEWIGRVNMALNADVLKATRQAANAAFIEVNDVASWNLVKIAITAKAATFVGATA